MNLSFLRISSIPLASRFLPLRAFISSSAFFALPSARTTPFRSQVCFAREFKFKVLLGLNHFFPPFSSTQVDRKSRGKRLKAVGALLNRMSGFGLLSLLTTPPLVGEAYPFFLLIFPTYPFKLPIPLDLSKLIQPFIEYSLKITELSQLPCH